MYILNLDEYKHLTLKRGITYVGENNADKITCYLPTYFKNYDLKDCFVLLHIFIENEDRPLSGNVVQLEIEDELYKGKYVSYFNISRTYTTKVQKISLKIEILNSDEVVAYTNSVSFDVEENKLATSTLPNDELSAFENFIIRLNEIEAQITSIQNDIDSLNGNVSTLDRGTSQLQSEITSLKDDIASTQSDISTLQSEVSQSKEELSDVSNKVSSLEQQSTTINGNLEQRLGGDE